MSLVIPEVKIFTEYPSATIAFGNSGMGKSFCVHWVIELFLSRGSKIIDIYDEGRFENCFIALPNPDKHLFWDIPNFKPKGYTTECFIPMSKTLPRKLPNIFRPFKIAFSDLKKEEFMILIGHLSLPQRELISLAWRKRRRNTSFIDFYRYVQDIVSDSRIKIGNKILEVCDDRSGLAFLLKLDKLHHSGLISDKDDPLTLNLDAIMKDKKTVTCFSFAFLEDRNMRHLLWAYLFRMIHLTRKKQQYYSYPELVLVHRELQKNAPARGKKSSTAYEGQSLALEQIKTIIEEPRPVGIRFLADSQFPMKIDSDVRKGFATHFLFQMDRTIVDQLGFWLDFKTMIGIQTQGVGDCAIKTRPERNNPFNKFGIQYPVKIPPTRSACKKHDDLFFKIWKKQGRKFRTWEFPKIEKVIAIRRLSKKEKEVTNLRHESLYEYYSQTIQIILNDNPGASLAQIQKDPLIKKYGWSTTKVLRITNDMSKKVPPALIRIKDGTKWKLYLPDQVNGSGQVNGSK